MEGLEEDLERMEEALDSGKELVVFEQHRMN